MSKVSRTTYTKEFKDEAVDLILTQGYKATEVAKNLGISYKMLCDWKAKRIQEGSQSFPGKGYKTDTQADLSTLKSENKRLRMAHTASIGSQARKHQPYSDYSCYS